MVENIYITFTSFYDHNMPLIYFGLMSIICLLLQLKYPSRFYTLLFIGFLVLAFAFEYDKHLYYKIQNDMLNQIFPAEERFTKYILIDFFLKIVFSMLLQIIGWGMIVISIFGQRKYLNEIEVT